MSLKPIFESENDVPKNSIIHRSKNSEIDLQAFHLLGDRSGLIEGKNSLQHYRPALFANYRDLSKLRYDFPLVLTNQEPDWIKPLSIIIDAASQSVTSDDPSMARQVLDLEYRIRKLLSEGQKGTLSLLWYEASQLVLSELDETMRPEVAENLSVIRAKIDCDGELFNYNQQLPGQLIKHGWSLSQQEKSQRLVSRIELLKQKLSDILRVDYLHSNDARNAARLESSMGAVEENVFDFQVMAKVLKSVPVGEPLPKSRKQRISDVLSIFESQRFVANDVLNFQFDNCEQALKAFNDRLPNLAALIKAISIAELEINNRYDESRHELFYSAFDESQLGSEDLALFPSYLVCLEDDPTNEALDILGSGLPFKIVVLKQNIVGETGPGKLSFGAVGQQLAHMALGLNNVFVMQTAATSLYQLRDSVLQGMSCDLPALFSLYAGENQLESKVLGDAEPKSDLTGENGFKNSADYLSAAAATESRVFPGFVFNPAAGDDLASRFKLVGNPSIELDWQRHILNFEDAEQNKVSEEVSFTLADFVASNQYYSQHFVFIAREQWNGDMLPVHSFLNLDAATRKDKLPYVLLVDQNDQLLRAICDAKIIEATQRNLDLWHKLQELGGIQNSHAILALQKIREQAEAQRAEESKDETLEHTKTAESATISTPETTDNTPPPGIEAEQEQLTSEISSDEPWIETIRCTSCNECTLLNDRMFAYDDDVRAYIADPSAGTFRELVEAAESCQVAIIHPGKPKNPDEPGLEELITRAEQF